MRDDLEVQAQRGSGSDKTSGAWRLRYQHQQGPFEIETVVQRAAVLKPGVRRAAPGAGAGLVVAGFVRRRRAAVLHDQRRAVVAPAESHARNIELQTHVLVQVTGGAFALGLSLGIGPLQQRRSAEAADRVGKVTGVGGVAFGQRFALRLITVQQLRRRRAADHGGQLPAEVDGVLDRRVVAQPASGREQVGGIATDEDAPALKTLRDQRVAGSPGADRQHLDGDMRAHGLIDNSLRVFSRPRLGNFVLMHGRVKGKLRLAVHRGHEGAPLRVDRDVHPGAGVGKDGVEIWRTQVDRKHLAAHELAFDAARAVPGDAQCAAHQTAWAIGAYQVSRLHLQGFAAGGGAHLRLHLAFAVFKALQRPAVTHLDTGQGFGLAAQGGFDKFLGHAVRQFGCAPGSAHGLDFFHRLRGGRQLQARQLVAGVAREVRNVGGVVGRQALGANFAGKTQTAEMLHGARLCGIGLRVEGGARLGVDQQAAHAAAAEFVGQHQPAGTATGDQDVGAKHVRHVSRRRSAPSTCARSPSSQNGRP